MATREQPATSDRDIAKLEIARIFSTKNSSAELIQRTRENINKSREIMAETDRILGKR